MNIIFECIIGSHAYGTNIESSDIDIKGVYQQPNESILGFSYQPQIEVTADIVYYEIKRFIELAATANPTILEMLFVDDRFIKQCSPQFEILRENRKLFLTKKCANSFGGYARAQIKKAFGLDKKMNWEKERIERRTPLHFCFVHENGKSINIVDWLKQNRILDKFVGLVALDRMPNCYAIYYDWPGHYGADLNIPTNPLGYRGICFEKSNDVVLSSVPKDQSPQCLGVLYYNKDAYSMHCKEFNEYQTWLENRNTSRYVETSNHNQRIDGKNMMHCIRLINCALEIVKTGNFTVYRPEADFLKEIRKGKHDLNVIMEEADNKIKEIFVEFEKSDLPDEFDMKVANDLLLEIRKYDN